MRHIILITTMLLLLPFTMSADVVFHEEFDEPWGWWGEDDPPYGWQIQHLEPFGTPWFQWQGTNNFARVETGYPMEPMSENLLKDDIDCTDYDNLELSYWLDLNWWEVWYPGTFLVYGSNDQFNHHCTTLTVFFSPYEVYDSTIVCDISEWADGQPTVGVWFRMQGKDLNAVLVDEVHIEGDYDTPVQPSSLGKLKAIYQ